MMSEFNAEDPAVRDRIHNLTEPAPLSELPENTQPGDKIKKVPLSDFKARLAALKAKANIHPHGADLRKPSEAPLPPMDATDEKIAKWDEEDADEKAKGKTFPDSVQIVPGDMGKPQNELEAMVEADRQIVKKAESDVEAASDKMLNAEALFTESLAEKSMDRDRFKAVFINTVQQECAGLTLDQIEESIRRDHEMLFDKRTGIQAKLAYRAELLKDATAEDRAKRLKDDWLFKPAKKVKAETTATGEKKASGPKKPAFDPGAAMRATLTAKFKKQGLSDDVVKAKVAEQLARFGL